MPNSDSLRAIEKREQENAIGLDALRAAVQDGINSGPSIPIGDVRGSLTARYKDNHSANV